MITEVIGNVLTIVNPCNAVLYRHLGFLAAVTGLKQAVCALWLRCVVFVKQKWVNCILSRSIEHLWGHQGHVNIRGTHCLLPFRRGLNCFDGPTVTNSCLGGNLHDSERIETAVFPKNLNTNINSYPHNQLRDEWYQSQKLHSWSWAV